MEWKMMDKEYVYEYVEESDQREIMELLDAVINRFREVCDDRELIVITVRKGNAGKEELHRIAAALNEKAQSGQ